MGRGDAVTGAVLGRVLVREKGGGGGGERTGGPGKDNCNDDQGNNWASLSPLSGEGEDIVSALPRTNRTTLNYDSAGGLLAPS
jgi:hypothetical protein